MVFNILDNRLLSLAQLVLLIANEWNSLQGLLKVQSAINTPSTTYVVKNINVQKSISPVVLGVHFLQSFLF